MRQPRRLRTIGFILAGLIALSIGARPTLQAQQAPGLVASSFVGGAFGGDAKNQAKDEHKPPIYLPAPSMTLAETKTRLKLHSKIPMNFPTDTPLEDVIRYIEQATIDKTDFPEGISIYLDPQGLQDADKTPASTVTLNLKSFPLETTLELMLKQLSLTYWINKDGLLIITHDSDELVTPGKLQDEIITSLSSLRMEVQGLRAEIKALRQGETGNVTGRNNSPAGPMGGMGGGFR